ncbi:S-layer homology domain-containing protein [Cohnella zeiphila]|uniref:S-layer homology domain-containing protein n=1 Tax=Cohnella zeiphila TaxID=2761120 RepID=A0A7X0SQY8_9BACL|nr:S-layer homology domain-containing protein [Cohnella zeiphila]MBB6732273.1 S-layer homology domain-containing protein [Cohnella zeiphila]
MKKLFMRKTAGLIALLMTVSMLVPILAYAASGFAGVHYTKYGTTGSATGAVYVDEDVYNAYWETKLPIAVYTSTYTTYVYATYVGFEEGKGYKFAFDNVYNPIFGTYSHLNFQYFYEGQLKEATSVNGSGFDVGVVGGGSAVSGSTISVGTDGNVNSSALESAFTAGNGSATLNLSGEFALLPASALLKGTTLTLVAGDVTYTLPLSALNLEDLAASLGVTVDALTIRVDISKLSDDAAKAVTTAVTNVGGKELADARDFKITAIAGDKTKELNDFGTYLSRAFTLSETPDASANVVGVVYDPTASELSFVPTSVTTTDGKTVATLKRTGNSIYTVISVDTKTFADLAGHWSQPEVEKLATNLIVNGVGENTFAPNRTITRAEFAAIIVRALGLTTNGTTDKFSDLSATAWYAGNVAAAAKAGIINGYTDGTFKPNANISRQELAAMVVRAMKFAGKDVSLTDAQVSTALAAFTDAKSLTWSKADFAVAVQEGVVKGQSATKLSPNATATRAEASAMVLRFLTDVDFIN